MFTRLAKISATAILVAFLGLVPSIQAAPTCAEPAVRKEWRTLSATDRAEFIRAVKCMTTIPHDKSLATTFNPQGLPAHNTSGSLYDDIVFMHMDVSPQMHIDGLALPWHRWFINGFEQALKENCAFSGTLPYWDWTKDAADFEHSSIYMDDDPVTGMGGWGDSTDDFQVTTGAFASGFHVSYPNYHRPRRNFTLQPYFPLNRHDYPVADLQANVTFTAGEVNKMVTDFDGDYQGMASYIDAEQGARWAVHLIGGGDFADACPTNAVNCTPDTKWSANDPLFWIHHAVLDKIWYDWQHYNHAANFHTFVPGPSAKNITTETTMVSDGLFTKAKFGDVIDTQGGFLCYKYE